MLAGTATRPGKLHKPEARKRTRLTLDRAAPERLRKEVHGLRPTNCLGDRGNEARSTTPDISVPPFGMARLEHCTGKIDAVGAAPGKGSAVAIEALRDANHCRAGQPDQIVSGRERIAIDALTTATAMAGEFRRINAEQPNTRACAMKRIAIGDVGTLAFQGGSRSLTSCALCQPQAARDRGCGCNGDCGYKPAAGMAGDI